MAPHGIAVLAASTLPEAFSRIDEVGRPAAVVMDITARSQQDAAVTAFRSDGALRDVPFGWVKKSAALDTLRLLLSSSAASSHYAA